MILIIIGIPVVMITLLVSDIAAEKIARYRLRGKIAAVQAAAPRAVIDNFSLLNK